ANLTDANLTRHNSGLSRDGDGFALEHRTKRGMITAAHSSPMRPPMVSEMKRINALNLEPALPKLDDKTRTDWINFKQQQSRPPQPGDTLGGTRGTTATSLKDEFKQSLEVIQSKLRNDQASSSTTPSAAAKPSGASQPSSAAAAGAEVVPVGDETPSRSKFAFNPEAKAFSFNPGASVFTPSGGGAGAQAPSPMAGQASAQRAPAAPVAADQPRFPPSRQAGRACKALSEVLDGVFDRARGEKTDAARPVWPEAERGIPFQEVLGKPNPQAPLGPLQGGGAAAPCQGGCMVQVPVSSPMGASPKFGTQMVPVMMQGGGGMHQQGSGQPGGACFAQGQPGAQPQQPPQQPQQGMMVPAGMVPVNSAMGASPKFGTQMGPVMVQGPQGQMMMMVQPGQMMMQQGFQAPRPMGGGSGGPPNQMQGEHS
ncbi:unnamed protein product, partial [Prorocentrum cordatum]